MKSVKDTVGMRNEDAVSNFFKRSEGIERESVTNSFNNFIDNSCIFLH